MVSPGSSAGYYREMPQVPPDFKISAATVHHVPVILNFIRKLAEYEKLSHEVVVDEDALRKFLFGPRPAAEAVLAFDGSQPVGFAVFFTSYSTFAGRPGLFLEDLFVEPEYRGQGIGKALLIHLARIVVEREYSRLEWSVLDWNQPSIDFYRSLGAEALQEWTQYRLCGEALQALASKSPASATEQGG